MASDTIATDNVQEVVAIFTNATDLQKAIDQLLTSGCDRSDISLLASEKAVEAKLGHRYERVDELEDDADAPRTLYVEKEAVGGAQAALVGALAYVGAVIGAAVVVGSGGAVAAALAAAAEQPAALVAWPADRSPGPWAEAGPRSWKSS